VRLLRASSLTLTATLVLVALFASRARAAPTWLAPTPLSGSAEDASVPQVAVDASGDAVMVWQRTSAENRQGSDRSLRVLR
jgi:hypothetical protein